MDRSEDITLNVPFTSQYAKDNGLKEEWKKRSCGIISLKMIIDFHSDEPIKTEELLKKALSLGGVNENQNWYHSTLVKTAINYGFDAWRRSWIPSSHDFEQFKKEGLNKSSLHYWQQQLKIESIPVITDEILSGFPLIVSAPPKFKNNGKSHLLVINGIYFDEEDVAGFFFLDPENKVEEDPVQQVSLEQFLENWTYRAIFVRPENE